MKYPNWVGMLLAAPLVAGTALLAESLPRLPFTPNAPVTVSDRHDTAASGSTVSLAIGQGDDDTAAGIAATYPCEGNVNCRWRLNVRTGPWGKIIDGFAPGTRITVVAREGDWYRIRHGNGYAFVHVSLVDIPGVPAYDGKRGSPYAGTAEKQASTENSGKVTTKPSADGINGPGIPKCLLDGIEAAKKSKWFTTPNKCLQYAGTIAAGAGAKPAKADAIYPHLAYPADTTLRGAQIDSLDDAAKAGTLKPGMLIHVKVHYDVDPAYNPTNDAHHWFAYIGMNEKGTPMFADCLRQGRPQTIDEIDRNMRGGSVLKYGGGKYGYVRRVTAVHDPFADRR